MPRGKHYPPKRPAQRDVKRWIEFYAPSPSPEASAANDLFGNPVIPDGPALTLDQRRRLTRKDPKPKGYAAAPGTGPSDETCGSCGNHSIVHQAKTYHKCALMRQTWTGGRATDILVRSPACKLWAPRLAAS
jgi:hypothetical protein